MGTLPILARPTRVLTLGLGLLLAACSQGPSPEVQARIDSLQTQRDSLNRALAQQNEYVQSLSRQIEDAIGEMGGEGAVSPENLGDRIGTLREQLRTARSRLSETEQRIAAVNRQARTLRDSLAAVNRRSSEAMAMQQDSIASLVTALDAMEGQVRTLTAERANLEEAVAGLEEELYTVYYVVGTRDQLLDRGLVEEKGGARVLLVLWRAGETLVPARDLDPAALQAMDRRSATSLELPGPGTYRIVSRHDTQYLEPRPDGNGRFTGDSLRITDPAQFWLASPYLIIVRED